MKNENKSENSEFFYGASEMILERVKNMKSENRGHGRCTVFGYIFKFSWPPFFIKGLYVGSMN